MFARVATFEGVNVSQVKRTEEETHVRLEPILGTTPGWLGAMHLADQTSGKMHLIAIFDSKENLRAADEIFEVTIPRALDELLALWGGTRVSIDQCEIVLQLPRGPGM